MADTEIQITEADLSTILTQKVGQCTNLEIRLAALSRVIQERDSEVTRLEERLSSLNGKEPSDAKGGKKEVPVYR
jgi:hypothetical protein